MSSRRLFSELFPFLSHSSPDVVPNELLLKTVRFVKIVELECGDIILNWIDDETF